MQNTKPDLFPIFAFIFFVVVLLTSPAKWQTLKKMAIAFLACAVMVSVLGFVICKLFFGPEMFEVFVYYSIPIGFLIGGIMGRQHARDLKKRAITPGTAPHG